MPKTFGDLKFEVRQQLWPAGEAENLVIPHNKDFIDCLIDLQTWVECQQQDNTSVVRQCSTFYNCGLTVLDAPRGNIHELSVIDKVNPTTRIEDPVSPDDWCSLITYREIDYTRIRTYLAQSNRYGFCLPIPSFFGLDPTLCNKCNYPTPTDFGVPKNLPVLPLGFHYAQSSTNRTSGRAGAGVWAKDRGKIYIAPWLQTTETVIIKWDGIKRQWTDDDLVDDDPLLSQAVLEWMRWKNADKWEKDPEEAARAQSAYVGAPGQIGAREMLIHQCREETRVRGIEGSKARSATASVTALFYNTDQSFTAHCGDGTEGDPVTVTVKAGMVASSVSVADANQRARDEAQTQAESRLDCQSETASFTNDAQTATAACQRDENAPEPDGSPVTVTIPAGTITSTVSKDDANAQALALALQTAQSQLVCTFWNRAMSYTATCPTGAPHPSSVTTSPHTFSSTLSQLDADRKALNKAKADAEAALSGCAGQTYTNTQQTASYTKTGCHCPNEGGIGQSGTFSALITVLAGTVTSNISQADANLQAHNIAQQYATQLATQQCLAGQCGQIERNWP